MDKTMILFDLDGTLTDPKVGITRSIQYSLQAFGIHVDNLDELTPFIGPPLKDSYREFYSFSDDELEKVVERYQEYFSQRGIFENKLYEGIDTLLKTLRDQQKTLIVATSKPTVFAEKILKHFEIDQYFSFVAGSELDGGRSRKDLVIAHAFENMEIYNPHRAVMIGDREYDIMGAKRVGIDSIGVLYGYGSFAELSGAGADHIVESVGALSELLGAH